MYICKEHEALECLKGKGKLCCCACSEENCEERCEKGSYGKKADCKFCEREPIECTRCGKKWKVSIYQKKDGYICPHCVHDERKEKNNDR